ncbi:cysteine desulfurase family protein [Paenibacillus beijingensis]|uniref:Cysteine desulfurase n=1 Tax=Paenibacillus beijingensis TaxID=1126833 RepID=A0A0D5NN42_9BACL|nr:cysteine desulfurase family protein [Paenibacillus beijingensis]AJY76343.1 cysteine desulfurase [Paenibacillus beijingensis]
MLYFDHCASTPPHPDVVRTMAEVMQLHYANPSSLHRAGREAEALIERARKQMANLFAVKPEEWVFTSGGTESNQLAIKGAAMRFRSRGNHLITTEVEHPSVYEAFRQLERSGFRVTYLPVDKTGTVSVTDLKRSLTEDTVLVSVMHVNNEVGTVQPIEEIGELLRNYPKTLFHVDGVQSIGKLPVNLKEWGIDLFSGSAHKLRGPKGIGLLYVREGLELEPLFSGGSQERELRAGTPNVAGIVAAAKAVRLAVEGQEERAAAMRALQSRLTGRLSSIPELVLNSCAPLVAPHIVHLSYPGMKPEVIVHQLEELGMLVSTKSACSSKDDKPSRVLLAMGCPRERAASGIRISFGDEHTKADIDALAAALAAAVQKLKPMERSETTTS